MITTIILGIITVLIIAMIFVIADDKAEAFWESIGTIFGMGVLWFFVNFFGSLIFVEYVESTNESYLKEKIYSLDIKNGGVSSNGSFFLGCGSFSSRGGPDYIMFCDSEGGKELLSVDATETIIYEDEDVSPYIIRKVYHKWDYSTLDRWFFFRGFGKREFDYIEKYKLHVPKNTIKINPMSIDVSKLN